MAKEKKAAVGPGMPARFEPDKQYNVIVAKQFHIAKFLVRPGIAILRGEIAEKNRGNLVAAWPYE